MLKFRKLYFVIQPFLLEKAPLMLSLFGLNLCKENVQLRKIYIISTRCKMPPNGAELFLIGAKIPHF